MDEDKTRPIDRNAETTDSPPRPLDEAFTEPARESVPERIGQYRIVRVIGEGGMGTVYLAEQTEPVHRQVALKIIKLGMDTKQVIARFEAERQALAMMDYPSIARVFDAGATEAGRPYFVMEYVPGVPITDYCDREKLDTNERLDLFIQVCEAVQHAHQKGVIHRDLKPGNILVSVKEGKAVPKVIDFGVAKATHRKLIVGTLFTEQGQLIGTPEYMSPEQAEMTGLDVDTRTDIYSLGVLLYELLTGSLPFEPGSLRQAGFDEIRRIIREDDPPRPSTRLSSLGDESSVIAKRRRTDPRSLGRQLHGDLDWIVMRALEKSRTRRYESAHGLAADIRRHFAHQPVVAGPPSASYRMGKFVRRNRAWVGGAAATFVVLLAGVVATSAFALRAERLNSSLRTQNERALDAIGQLIVEVGEVDEWGLSPGVGHTEAGIDGPDGSFLVYRVWQNPDETFDIRFNRITTASSGSDDVAVDALAYFAVDLTGAIWAELTARASELEQVAEFQSSQFDAIVPELMGAGLRDAIIEATSDEEREYVRTVLGGINFTDIGLASLQANVFEPALKAIDEQFADQDLLRARLLQTISVTVRELGLFDLATGPQVQALAIRRAELGDEHPDTLISICNMVRLLLDLERMQEAESLAVECYESNLGVYGITHPETADAIKLLVDLYTDWHEAEPDKGYDAKAEEWREKLEEANPTQDEEPAESESDDS